MLKLNKSGDEALRWIEIIPAYERKSDDGQARETVAVQRTQVRPMTTAMVLAARAAASNAVLALLPQGKESADADPVAIAVAQAEGQVVFTRTCARLAIMAWEGVCDADGHPAPVTPENVEAYIDNWDVFDTFDEKYVIPSIAKVSEKNASSLSPNGTSAGVRNTAKGANNSKGSGAKRAPTKRKPRKQGRASKSGKS